MVKYASPTASSSSDEAHLCLKFFCTNQTNRELYVCVPCAVLVRLVPDKRFPSEYKTPKTHHVAGDNAGDICAAEEGLATHCTDVVHPPAKFLSTFPNLSPTDVSPNACPAAPDLPIQSQSRCSQRSQDSTEPYAPWGSVF